MTSSSTPMLRRGEACSECRRRKLRCDGVKPHCTICTRANRDCRYERPVTRPVYLVLQERLAFLESKFLRLSSSSSSVGDLEADLPGEVDTSPVMLHSPSATFMQRIPSPQMPAAPPAPTTEMSVPGWWEAESLPIPIRDYLIGIFIQNYSTIHFQFHVPTFMARLNSSNLEEYPHPAFLEGIYLFACYFSSRYGDTSLSLSHLEDHFLTRARQAQMDSLSFSDRLMDFLRGSILTTQYLLMRGRFLEGYHVHCGAARFALSCGIHRIPSSIFPSSRPAQATSVVLLPPPANSIELGERILTFWMSFYCDKLLSIVAGFVGALPSESDPIDSIQTVFPRAIEDYAEGNITLADDETLKTHLCGEAPTGADASKRPDTPFTVILKGLATLERASRLGATFRVQGPTNNNVLMLRNLETASHRFTLSLPELGTFASQMATSATMTPTDLSTLVAHTTILGSQMEIHHTLIEVDDRAYAARLACALGLADLASLTKDGGFYTGSLIGVGYCWCFAAQVLIQHIQTDESNANEAYETGLANIVNALEKLSVTFPTLVHQFKQVQQALGRITGSGLPSFGEDDD